eukprot:TRINITY_DN26834_c0_g1_i1.p2 TRINITY_DN26834_c0_g1~~TRINITY_DN26834_c0_g1_i1.p2  ORF type:complete len:330 (+),score=108.22 TRINITY_DN26834_c0_g1_i1:94-1083(+)
MAFVLDVATDLFGSKQNTKLEFAGVPSLSELIVAVEGNFDKESQSMRHVAEPFRVQTMQVFDDVLQRWVDLYSNTQLKSNSQVFVFQPSGMAHSDVPGTIPAAKFTQDSYLGSPTRARIATDLGINAALSEKLRRIYSDLEIAPSHLLPLTGLRQHLLAHNIMWEEAAIGDLFRRSADLAFEDWARWGLRFPALIDTLYYAQYGVKLDQPLYTIPENVPPTRAESDNLAARRAREEELRRSYALGWTAERETIDRDYRAQRKAELDLQIRHLKTKNELDRIRAYERADADHISLNRAMIANAASPPRRRDDLCRMYYSPASPKFGYLSP